MFVKIKYLMDSSSDNENTAIIYSFLFSFLLILLKIVGE